MRLLIGTMFGGVAGAAVGMLYAVQVPESKLAKIAWLLKAAWKVVHSL